MRQDATCSGSQGLDARNSLVSNAQGAFFLDISFYETRRLPRTDTKGSINAIV